MMPLYITNCVGSLLGVDVYKSFVQHCQSAKCDLLEVSRFTLWLFSWRAGDRPFKHFDTFFDLLLL